jgi:hypothetical protein
MPGLREAGHLQRYSEYREHAAYQHHCAIQAQVSSTLIPAPWGVSDIGQSH